MSNELYADNMLEKIESSSGYIFRVNKDYDAVWMSQEQLATFFDVSLKDIRTALSRSLTLYTINKTIHIRRVSYVDNALNVARAKQESQYNLYIICCLAFNITSPVSHAFQQFSIGVLNRYLLKGAIVDIERVKHSEKRQTILKQQLKKLDS